MKKFDKVFAIVVVLSLIYSLVFSYLSILRMRSFNAHYYDLGIMHQVVYNTYKGNLFEFTNPHLSENSLRSAVHFDLMLVPLALFYFIYPSAETLLVVQSFFLGFSAIFIYLIGKEVLRSRLISVVVVIIYLFYYPIHFINLFDFHAVSLSVFFLLAAYYWYLKSGFRLNQKAFLMLFLASITKENIILVASLFCFFAFLKSKDKANLISAGVFLLWFLIVIKLLIPLSADGNFFGSQFYSMSLKQNLNRLFSNESLDYLVEVFSSLMFLPLVSVSSLFPAVSEFLKNLLSEKGQMRNLYFHYLSGSVAFLFVSVILSIKKISSTTFFKQKKDLLNFLLLYLVFFSLFLAFNKGPLSNIYYDYDQKKYNLIISLQKKYADYNIKLSSSGIFAPFFSGRRYFYDFSFDPTYFEKIKNNIDIIEQYYNYEKADVVILDESELNNELINKIFEHMTASGKFVKVFSSNGVLVYERQK
ncbi:MAG: hypothetical protein KatS3mg091_012 [Patescibacteria group bacterium]|nr:MAG: hypothetical protein KatS3mg091_012 [Patescibacteria group bacterium]